MYESSNILSDDDESSNESSIHEATNINLKHKYTKLRISNDGLDVQSIKINKFTKNAIDRVKEKFNSRKSDVYIPFSKLNDSKDTVSKTQVLSSEKKKMRSSESSVVGNENVLKDKRKKCKSKKINTSNKKNCEVENIEISDQCTASSSVQNLDGNSTPVVNVFQFMMDSRHKRIGTNSPGKENTEEIVEISKEEKEKLSKRKLFLEEWSDKKGGSKRKYEEDKEKYITKILNKRAKKMKKMLNITDEREECNEVEKEANKPKPKLTKQKERNLDSSDSENSCDNLSNCMAGKENNENNDTNDTKTKSLTSVNKNETFLKTKSKHTNEILSLSTGKTNLFNYFEQTSKTNKHSNNLLDLDESELVDNDSSSKERENKVIKVKFNFSKKFNPAKTKKNKKISQTNDSNNLNSVINMCDSTNDCEKLNSSLDDFEIFPKKCRTVNQNSTIKNDTKNSKFKKQNLSKKNDTSKNIRRSLRLKPIILVDDDGVDVLLSDDESISKIKETTKKEVKLAPLFLKQDRAYNEVKKKCSENIKIKQNKQISETIELNLFPKISHVQQKNNDDFWDLPKRSMEFCDPGCSDYLKKIDRESLRINSITETKSVLNSPVKSKLLHKPPKKIPNVKQLIKELKNQCPTYPVYKTFRVLCQKGGARFKQESKVDEKPIVSPKRKGGRSKKKIVPDDKVVATELSQVTPSQKIEMDAAKLSMWSDKYKPRTSDDIVGNSAAIGHLKLWLQSWVEYSKHLSETKEFKFMNSSDDFCSDSDTRDFEVTPQNTLVILGPHGSGKTSAIYALCNEFDVNIIEINASSKRPGKRIILELQEATQSHQVKNTDVKTLNGFFQKVNQQSEENTNKKFSLLLVEDVDIVFDDQDEGFIGALMTLIATSKRPIILTATDPSYVHLQKIIDQHKCIIFKSLTSKMLGIWLQILCLVEGVRVDRETVSNLLDWHGGDVRRTLMELQFWTQTGGDGLKMSQKENSLPRIAKLSIKSSRKFLDCFIVEDDSSNMSWMSNDSVSCDAQDSEYVHTSCLDCFVPYYQRNSDRMSLPLDLVKIWWNLPRLLYISHNTPEESDLFQLQNSISNENTKSISLNNIVNILDSLANADVLFDKLKMDRSNKLNMKFWDTELVNSLSLEENMTMFDDSKNTAIEMTYWSINSGFAGLEDELGVKFEEFNMALPTLETKRLKTKQFECSEEFASIVPLSYQIDRRALCHDYISLMRTISRTEQTRSAMNGRRNNRFYHYLKGLGVNLPEAMYETVCNTFL